ncbi:hypothetical protein BKA00_000732 [Actinomadura coerulea]|uniref:DUF3592 domain-containing protein n=1 Tax=Actinomadura coerulea TaxID=46159 RepID=A0A7X0FU98_9ACTN|nr:hypothetical protein [Actinomadura coerulea]MBB6393818.1 hypothetical protein [Actinomadura coerulea]GGP90029.1 hypothetical protein GCM10010187_01680 [Actinomadura coerulea]
MAGYGKRPEWAPAALLAVGAPLAGLALIVAQAALNAYGPSTLAGNWAGTALLFVMMMAGYALLVFTQLRYANLLVFFGAFFLLVIGASMVAGAVSDQALRERGRTTACTVQKVDRREVTSTDSDGNTTTHVYYDHDLACAEPRVRTMTTGSRVAGRGERVQVVYDPRGRLDPRPAGSVGDPGTSLKRGAALFGGGVLLRVLFELNVPPLGPGRGLWLGRRRRRRSVRVRPPSP